MMILDSEKSKLQRGSIMLEVIAVLALMGVMGAMLFRQIYQRNQELHNIQMASEIRTVKEAFAAYIQANAADIQTKCHDSIPSPTSDEVKPCLAPDLDLVAGIKEYLPDGWFTGDTLGDYYHFTLWFYRQRDASQAVKMYGVIAPTDKTLPATGWNFKRAARVSLLIGADGGAYASDITNDDIAGSLGTWHLKADPDDPRSYNPEDYGLVTDKPTYVAMTGLDNFTPEYDKEEVRVNLQKVLNLQISDLNAYHLFSVANKDSDCFTTGDNGSIKHHQAKKENGVYVVENDTVTDPLVGGNCLPTFWVDPNNGTVNTSVDLNVGKTSGGANSVPAIRLSKNGVILFSKTVQDPQDGDKEKSYLLDPAYTSIMNDIKLVSRGGASLSDILPNYILKSVEEIENGEKSNITLPDCPTGYVGALVVIPTSWAPRGLSVDIPALSFNKDAKTKSEEVTVNVDNKVNIPALSFNENTAKTQAYSNVAVNNDTGVCVQIGGNITAFEKPTTTTTTVIIGKRTLNGTSVVCSKDNTAKGIVQIYCVFQEASTFTNKSACEAAGYTWNGVTATCGGEKKPIKRPAADWTAAKTESECYALGGTQWSTNGTCS